MEKNDQLLATRLVTTRPANPRHHGGDSFSYRHVRAPDGKWVVAEIALLGSLTWILRQLVYAAKDTDVINDD